MFRSSAVAMSDEVAAATSGERINKLIDLENPKVVNQISLNAGEKCVVCRCWKRSVTTDSA